MTHTDISMTLFESLLDGEYDFYGVDGNCFCIGLNGTRAVFEALVDENDDRSYFDSFRTSDVGKVFFRSPLARVRLRRGGFSTRLPLPEETETTAQKMYRLKKSSDDFFGWILEDVDDGHIWLTVGTDYGEDYYPCFTFRYEPNANRTIEQEAL